jgi:hypothetical protein
MQKKLDHSVFLAVSAPLRLWLAAPVVAKSVTAAAPKSAEDRAVVPLYLSVGGRK